MGADYFIISTKIWSNQMKNLQTHERVQIQALIESKLNNRPRKVLEVPSKFGIL